MLRRSSRGDGKVRKVLPPTMTTPASLVFWRRQAVARFHHLPAGLMLQRLGRQRVASPVAVDGMTIGAREPRVDMDRGAPVGVWATSVGFVARRTCLAALQGLHRLEIEDQARCPTTGFHVLAAGTVTALAGLAGRQGLVSGVPVPLVVAAVTTQAHRVVLYVLGPRRNRQFSPQSRKFGRAKSQGRLRPSGSHFQQDASTIVKQDATGRNAQTEQARDHAGERRGAIASLIGCWRMQCGSARGGLVAGMCHASDSQVPPWK